MPYHHTGLAIALLALGTTVLAGNPAIRIVACDEKVQSHKRGICANQLSPDDFKALAPGVSWWYNWHFESTDAPPAGVSCEFVPMVWGDGEAGLEGLKRRLTAGPAPRAVLAINEPNLKGQSFLSPEDAAALYGKIKAVADPYKIPVIGPHMALGSSADSSIKAMDPLEKKDVTYTFMVPFLKAFLFYADKTDVAATAFHSYGNIDELRWAANLMNKEFQRPVWVTEFAQWSAPSPAAARKYLIQATDFLERTPYVNGYAWFKERVGKNHRISLFEEESGKLTALGATYVAMPVHDADLYYRIPGRLPAGNYTVMQQMEVEPTAEADGVLDLMAHEPGAWADYQLYADKAGSYTIRVQAVGTTGALEILAGERALATMPAVTAGSQPAAATITLPAGAQVLRIRCEAKGQSIHSLTIERH